MNKIKVKLSGKKEIERSLTRLAPEIIEKKIMKGFKQKKLIFMTILAGNLGLLGFFSMMFFLGVLTIGFIYEWKKGALEWQ